jgi:hypothetical protein
VSRGVRRPLARIALGGIAAWGVIAYLLLPALWDRYEHHRGFERSPRITRTSDGSPGDPLNVALVASERELERALHDAGWRRAAALGLASDLEIAGSVVLGRPDPTAPVSDLYLFGRKQDLAFEQELGDSAKQRHHVRFWRWDSESSAGRPIWLGSATFDRGVGLSHRTGQITHHIAPDIDADRDALIAGLAAAGQLVREYWVGGAGLTLWGRNGGGDRYFTDGELAVGVVSPDNAARTQPPEVSDVPAPLALKQWLFAGLRPLLD